MNTDPRRIIVTESCCDACNVHTVRVHHEHFPEMRVEGSNAELAAGHLANRLSSAHDYVPDAIHREAIRVALADTRAFLDRTGPIHPGRDLKAPQSC